MNSIGNIGGYGASAVSGMGGVQRMQRPDPSKMAENLFSRLDTKGQGYIEKSDLQSALEQLSSSGDSGSSASVDQVFSSLDGNGDGKVTKDEMASSLQKIAAELDSQFNKLREGGMNGASGMPPPPPPQGAEGSDDTGYTKEELTSQLKEIGSSDSKRSSLISNIVDNFEKADSDGDGKVSFKEAMAYDHASQAGASGGGSSATASGSSATSGSNKLDSQIMKQIMELMRAYGSDSGSSVSSLMESISTTA
jgi:Ca2+-binding EF-hand superfamily protein